MNDGYELRVKKALSLMQEAETIMLRELLHRNPASKEIAEACDLLEHALEFTEHSEEHVCLCPRCGEIAVEKIRETICRCLGCDAEWDIDLVYGTEH